MSVGIYDEHAHEVRLTSYGEPGDPLQVPKLAPEETFSWWVYQHQQPLIIPSLDVETRFPVVVEMLRTRGVRSVCALPLTAVHRRLGALTLDCTQILFVRDRLFVGLFDVSSVRHPVPAC